MPPVQSSRSQHWRWLVCGLLLFATMINYMDRLTLNQLKVFIEKDLQLREDVDYGDIEACFGLAFAVGAIVFGFIVDRYNVYWVYPLALIAWSAAGFLTAYAGELAALPWFAGLCDYVFVTLPGRYTWLWWLEGRSPEFGALLLFRVLLGFAEAANWPCALRTTQRILEPSERSMGNSILQSGAAVGAILIPLVLLVLFSEARPETWRQPFLVVGAAGTVWVVFWWAFLRPADLAPQLSVPAAGKAVEAGRLPVSLLVRRFFVLIVLVVSINMTWHFLRAWHPSFLQKVHGFTSRQTSFFSAAYYLFTDVGALAAGFLSLWLARQGMTVHGSRRLVFLGGAALTLFCLVVPFVSEVWLLIGMLLLVGFGALGVFPCYYSFSQDLTVRHQGKVTGILGACCWVAMFVWQSAIGRIIPATGSYQIPFLIAGLAPMVGFVALALLWGKAEEPAAKVVEAGAGGRRGEVEASTQVKAAPGVTPG